jgi:hypothetical protein
LASAKILEYLDLKERKQPIKFVELCQNTGIFGPKRERITNQTVWLLLNFGIFGPKRE